MGCGASSDAPSASGASSRPTHPVSEETSETPERHAPLASVVPPSSAVGKQDVEVPGSKAEHDSAAAGVSSSSKVTSRDAISGQTSTLSVTHPPKPAASSARQPAAAVSQSPAVVTKAASPLPPRTGEPASVPPLAEAETTPDHRSTSVAAVPHPSPPTALAPAAAAAAELSQAPAVTLEERADRGDVDAMIVLGEAMEKKCTASDGGDGAGGGPTSAEAKAAFAWYQRAASAGSAQGMSYTAWCLRTGFGTQTPDAAAALVWYRKAAEKGHAKAQTALGYMLQKGEGGAPDVSAAAQWYRQAAEQNEATAQLNLALLYESGSVLAPGGGSSGGEPHQLAEAFRLFLAAAKQGNVNACINVGYAFERGKGVEANMTSAFEWYWKAAEAGDDTAQAIVGCCYERGLGIPAVDILEAKRWYTKSALQGNQHARQGLKRIAVETGAVK